MATLNGGKLRYPQEPLPWTLKEIRDQIPLHLFSRNTLKSIAYSCRSIALAVLFFNVCRQMIMVVRSTYVQGLLGPNTCMLLTWSLWLAYWWFQSLALTGLWVMAHECNHGAFSENKTVCDWVGFVLHSALFTPYFSWQISHHRHHSFHASMEKDESYVPKTRKDLGIPVDAGQEDLDEIFGDAPFYTLLLLIRQQLVALHAYYLFNVSGQIRYPKNTSHFNPSSVLFTPSQRRAVILSNIGIVCAAAVVASASYLYGSLAVFKYYGIPWMMVNHWVVMITYMHHTDPILPHYRQGLWNYQRGATATIDRDFLGWQGRFFLYNVAHFHVIHHFFPKMPWYHGEEATKYLCKAIGPYYLHSSKSVFRQLWDIYNFCQFVDDEGDIVYYRNREGKTIMEIEDYNEQD